MALNLRGKSNNLRRHLAAKFSNFISKKTKGSECKQKDKIIRPNENKYNKEHALYKEEKIQVKKEKIDVEIKEEKINVENSSRKHPDKKSNKNKSSKICGTVMNFISEKGFGFIKSDKFEEEIFFHISNLVQKYDIPIFKHDIVEFEVSKEEKGYEAKKVHILLNFGVIVYYKEEDGYGFIRDGRKGESVFFHISDYQHNNEGLPATYDYVAFSEIVETEKGKQAKKIRTINKLYGEVTSCANGKGKILPTNSEKEIKFFWKDIVGLHKEDYRVLEIGDTVSFLLSSKKPDEAICVRSDYSLRRFADLGNENEMLKDLAENKALEENWNFANKNGREAFQILRSYIFYTFSRLEDEDQTSQEESKKILIEKSENGKAVAVFDTGLVDKQYRELYAVFEEKRPIRLGSQLWKLVGFCARGERIKNINYLTLFKQLPQRAEYFDNPADLLYDPKLRLDAITDHIIGDRGERLPADIRKRIPEDMTDENQILSFLSNFLEMAIKRAKERIKWNYKAAIPQYYSRAKKIQLLLPLCIDDPRKVDVALAVQRKNEVYVGYTILELDWAYSNARLISRPDSEWLTPNKIDCSDVENT